MIKINFLTANLKKKVFYQIATRGYWVIPQYEASGSKIDMIIIGFNSRLAVEVDGKYWHSGERKEKEDYERQKKLERQGWEFWRVSDRDFNKNEKSSLEGLWENLNEMKIYPLKWWKADKKPSFLKRVF